MKTNKSMAPASKGNDSIYTPEPLAEAIVDFFNPRGVMMEPCAATDGNHFANAMRKRGTVLERGLELDTPLDFFFCREQVDWIITNPPFSFMADFIKHAMDLAPNIVFLANLNVWMTKHRLRMIEEKGFFISQIVLVDTPPPPWRQTGFQLAATYLRQWISPSDRATTWHRLDWKKSH